jgi:hypothetical protein
MSKLGTIDRKKDSSFIRKAKAYILKELVNHLLVAYTITSFDSLFVTQMIGINAMLYRRLLIWLIGRL